MLRADAGHAASYHPSHPGRHGFDRFLVTRMSSATTTLNCLCDWNSTTCGSGRAGAAVRGWLTARAHSPGLGLVARVRSYANETVECIYGHYATVFSSEMTDIRWACSVDNNMWSPVNDSLDVTEQFLPLKPLAVRPPRRRRRHSAAATRHADALARAHTSAQEPMTGSTMQVSGAAAEAEIRRAVANQESFMVLLWAHCPHKEFVALAPWRQSYLDRGYNESLADYYGCISEMDAEIGRLLAVIDSLGQGNDTIFVFNSDNGTRW